MDHARRLDFLRMLHLNRVLLRPHVLGYAQAHGPTNSRSRSDELLLLEFQEAKDSAPALGVTNSTLRGRSKLSLLFGGASFDSWRDSFRS